MIVPYVDSRSVMTRLDFAVSPQNWRAEYHQVVLHAPDPQTGANREMWGMECRLMLRIHDEWIEKRDIAEIQEREPVKGSYSNSLKRAAVQWGVGRDLYDIRGPIFADVLDESDKRGRYYGKIAVGNKTLRYRWNPPPLDSVRKFTGDELPDEETEQVIPVEPDGYPTRSNPEIQKQWLEYYRDHPANPSELVNWCKKALIGGERWTGEKRQNLINKCALACSQNEKRGGTLFE